MSGRMGAVELAEQRIAFLVDVSGGRTNRGCCDGSPLFKKGLHIQYDRGDIGNLEHG